MTSLTQDVKDNEGAHSAYSLENHCACAWIVWSRQGQGRRVKAR